MQKVTIKAYAVSHKLSMFNVMKMVKAGKLKSEVVEEEGRDVTYILLDDKIEDEIKEGIVTVEKVGEAKLQEEMKMLTNEVQLLRAEIEALKKKL
jgi:signal-transduction protein with cAMP-binding, CBS, and nucleotidyltransferase domain